VVSFQNRLETKALLLQTPDRKPCILSRLSSLLMTFIVWRSFWLLQL